MMKKRLRNYEEKIVEALKKLPNPLEDKKHNLYIYFDNGRARSNESRLEHAADSNHGLTISDIERIPKLIKKGKLRIDKTRQKTFNLYLKRYSYTDRQYIKISLRIEPNYPKEAHLKTIQIVDKVK